MLVKPETSIVIPLRACGFKFTRLRPLHSLKSAQQRGPMSRGDKKFEWTDKAQISLNQEESLIFQQAPITLESKMLRNTTIQTNNNKIFMVLTSNIYSIKSFVDFTT